MTKCNHLSYVGNAAWKTQLHIIKISVKLNNCNSPFEKLSSLVISSWYYAKEAHNEKEQEKAHSVHKADAELTKWINSIFYWTAYIAYSDKIYYHTYFLHTSLLILTYFKFIFMHSTS